MRERERIVANGTVWAVRDSAAVEIVIVVEVEG
jgi:hypothetical protein